MYLNSMSEFKTIHTLLSFLPPSSRDPSPLHKRTQFSPCLMLANPSALSQLLLVFILPLYPDFAPKSVLGFRSPLVVVQRSFPPPISVMPFILSPLKGQKMLFRSPKPSPISSISLSPQHHSSSPQKSWHEGCGQDQTPSPPCQTSYSVFGLCLCTQGLDPG